MPSALKDSCNLASSGLGTRLDGWKEIAVYLDRGERTVKRWEKERGLPTHRIPGEGRPSVFAYTTELQEWICSSGDEGSSQIDEESRETTVIVESKLASAPLGAAITDAALPLHDAQQKASPTLHKAFPNLRQSIGSLAICGLLLLCLTAASLVLVKWRRSIVTAAPRNSNVRLLPDATLPASSNLEKVIAHDLYLHGRYEWNQRTPDSLNRAVDNFTQAIVHDPNFAEAYAGLAESYALLRQYSTMPNGEAFSRSLTAARKAVELNDSLPEAHRALAFAEMYGSWDFTNAEKEFHRAIELDPKDPVTRRWYANAFAVPGHFEESIRQMDIAQSLDPTSHTTMADKGWMLFLNGRQDEGIRILKDVERSVPRFASPHTYLMHVGFELRDYSAFLDEGEKMSETRNEPALRPIFAAARRGYAREGERGLLQALYSAAKKSRTNSNVIPTILAKVEVRLGKNQEAMQVLDEEYASHDPDFLAFFSHPSLLSLKGEPHYQALMQKINFPTHYSDVTPSYLVGMSISRGQSEHERH